MVSPGVFIPVLEENGIISKLDKIVLEKVCEWLRSWMDKGFKVMMDDFGHLENSGLMAESGYYYVFITDITDTITEAQKNHIHMRNKYYNNPHLLNK